MRVIARVANTLRFFACASLVFAALNTTARAQSTGTFELITPNFDESLLESVGFSYTLSQGVNANTFNFTLANLSNSTSSSWVNGTRPTITNIYFDDSQLGLLSTPAIVGFQIQPPDNSVSYSVGTPGTGALPGGNNVDFEESFSFLTNPPPSKSGIDPGEWLTVSFQSSNSYQDILAALTAGELRIGMHVQEIGTKGLSASFVSTPPVPEPGGALLLGVVGMIALLRRRRLA